MEMSAIPRCSADRVAEALRVRARRGDGIRGHRDLRARSVERPFDGAIHVLVEVAPLFGVFPGYVHLAGTGRDVLPYDLQVDERAAAEIARAENEPIDRLDDDLLSRHRARNGNHELRCVS